MKKYKQKNNTILPITIFGPMLFWRYKIKEIVNKLLLAEEKFILKMHWRLPGFMYSTCGAFPKNKERIKQFRGIGDSRSIYKTELEKAFF